MSLSQPRRILIIRLSHLGDVAHALGLYHALHQAYPRAEIGWAIQPEFAPLVSGLSGLGRVLLFERRGGARAWIRLARALEDFRADWAVDVQGNLKSGLVSVLSGARRRVACAAQDWQEPWAAGTAGEHAAPALPPASTPASTGALHALQRVTALVRHLLPHAPLPLRTDPELSEVERVAGRQSLAAWLPTGSPVLVHLSSPGDNRSWPGQRWIEFLRGLEENGLPVLVLSGPAEAELGRELERELPGSATRHHCVEQRGVRELCALFAAAAERDGRLVACDSGPMHLAWISGLGVDLLEGPEDARRTGPWPLGALGPHRTHRAENGPDCSPCRKRRCTHDSGPVCMTGLEARQVLAALRRQ